MSVGYDLGSYDGKFLNVSLKKNQPSMGMDPVNFMLLV